MFKKTLAAAAVGSVLGALCFTAAAADITVYGVVDTALSYTHSSDADIDLLEMNTGNYAGPRVGLKGTETLSDNLKVGFILENGFNSDTGTLGQGGRIFGRESQIYLTGDWGTFGFGRFGAFSSGSSSLSWYWDMEPFETGYTDAGIQATQTNAWRLNSNAAYYVSPVFAGFKFGIQHSITGTADKEAEKWSDNNTFTNAAVRWDGANAKAIFGFEMETYGKPEAAGQAERQNMYNVKLAGAWTPDGGPLTVFAGATWFKNVAAFSDSAWDTPDFNTTSGKRLNGYSGYVGARYTIGRADLLASVQYMDGENKAPVVGAETDFKRYVGAVGCHYHFSGRTMLYAVAAYSKGEGLLDDYGDGQYNRLTTHLGLTHFF